MLAHVQRARTHLGDIQHLELRERFDTVLLASHLVNTPDEDVRAALLAGAVRHLRSGGLLLVQWHPPDWFDGLRPGVFHEGTIGRLTSRLDVLGMDGDLLTAEVSYSADGDGWTQPFQGRRLTLDQLDLQLHSAGLRRVPLSPAHPSWFAARLLIPAAP